MQGPGPCGQGDLTVGIVKKPALYGPVGLRAGMVKEPAPYRPVGLPAGMVKEPAPCGLGPWGGDGGQPWDDKMFTGIKKIFLTKGEAIYSIQMEYDYNGQSIWSVKHGCGNEGTPHLVLCYTFLMLYNKSNFYHTAFFTICKYDKLHWSNGIGDRSTITTFFITHQSQFIAYYVTNYKKS